MRRLREIKGDEAIDVLAELLEYVTVITNDEDIKALLQDEDTVMANVVKVALKKYKKEIINILAIMNGVPVEKYDVNLAVLPQEMLALANDPDVVKLFTSQGQMISEESSGSATQNTTATGETSETSTTTSTQGGKRKKKN